MYSLEKHPAIFNTTPAEKLSKRYNTFTTIDVVNALQDNGFIVTKASQNTARNDNKLKECSHVVRLAHKDYLKDGQFVESETPEIVIRNSHNGASPFTSRIGIFRFVCANGIITGDTFHTVKIRHYGKENTIDTVMEKMQDVIDLFPQVYDKVKTWKEIDINKSEQLALTNVIKEEINMKSLDSESLLLPKRIDDGSTTKRNVWQTFNTIQENVIRGNALIIRENGKIRKSCGIRSASRDFSVNQAMWDATENFIKQLA